MTTLDANIGRLATELVEGWAEERRTSPRYAESDVGEALIRQGEMMVPKKEGNNCCACSAICAM